MVLSHRHKFVFSVIPKTASATLRYALREYSDIGWPNTKYEEHLSLVNASKEAYFKYYKEYFSFSFVRNPYDRIYSGYLQDVWASKNIPKWGEAKKGIFDSVNYSFSRYLQEYVSQANLLEDWSWICFCPMWAFTEHENFSIDFIGKFETFDHHLAKLSNKLGVDICVTKSLNVKTENNKELKYLEYFSTKDIECVNTLYEKDFSLFDYTML